MTIAFKIIGVLLILAGSLGNWVFGIKRGETGNPAWRRRSIIFDLSVGVGTSILLWGPE